MQFGICTSVENAAAVKAAGWDFVEENVQSLLQGQLADADWKGAARTAGAAAPILAANCLVPGPMKIVGPVVDREKLRAYMVNVLRRAQQLGIATLVFGSGGARQVPDGWDRQAAFHQIVDFGRMVAPMAYDYGVLIVIEHLWTKECNVINSIAEAMTYVKAVDHPNFQCLADSYHFWQNGEELSDLKAAVPWVKHVHLAEKGTRTAPGESGGDYRAFFRVLKQGGYDGPVSIEAVGFKDIAGMGPRVLEFIKRQWAEA